MYVCVVIGVIHIGEKNASISSHVGEQMIDSKKTEAFPELQKDAGLFSVATLSAV